MDEDESNGYVNISNDNSDVMWMKNGPDGSQAC